MGKGCQGGRFYLRTQLIDALIEPYEGLEVPGAVNTLG